MQGKGSSEKRVPRKKEYEIVEGVGWAFSGAGVSITLHALPSKYDCGPFFVVKHLSEPIESVVFYVASEDLSARGGNDACYEVQLYQVAPKKSGNLHADAG